MSSHEGFFDEVLGVIGRLVVLAAGTLGTVFIFGIALKPLLPFGLPAGRDGRLILMIVIACALGVGHLLTAVAVERGRWEVTGLGPGAWHPLALLTGPMLGILAVSAPAVVLLLLGSVDIVPAAGTGWSVWAGDSILVATLVALVAELAYRGYAIGLLAERWGNVAAVAVTMLAASWLAHVGFVATQTVLLHAPVGDHDLSAPPGYALVPGDPVWLTGGTLGLGAGAAVTASLAVITFLVFRPRRAHIRPARV